MKAIYEYSYYSNGPSEANVTMDDMDKSDDINIVRMIDVDGRICVEENTSFDVFQGRTSSPTSFRWSGKGSHVVSANSMSS
ncbi:hypothetical protein KIN20_026433 [Parelaphostrongylus tenuis]|uniref:Uncharacterized protein n=1 Tax=Parelaphostrongylus tenuis TaxID=148309 RepID=A0AAD5WCV4_PARTN|nr:hypothetical protein KIN20_026433 [Parelaphostrongylus tenuis]